MCACALCVCNCHERFETNKPFIFQMLFWIYYTKLAQRIYTHTAMSKVEFEYPVFEKGLVSTIEKKKTKKKQVVPLPPPPIEPSERKAGEEMPPRRSVAAAASDSKRLFFQNIDRENPNGPPRQLAPSVQELRDQVVYRDARGRKYALVSEKEDGYLRSTIDAILSAHSSPSSQQTDAVFMWVILPPPKRKNAVSTAPVSWPMINERLQLETTIPVFKVQRQKKEEKKTDDTTLLKPVKKQPPYKFEASVIAVASGGPVQQWHQRKTSWVILSPTIKGKGKKQ
jgi:hypothetical protein